MYKLGNQTPEWHELLPDVSAQFRPISRAMVRAARRAMRQALAAADDAEDADACEASGDEFDRSLIRDGLVAWRGIGDAAGKPLKVTAQSVEMFLEDARLFARASAVYVVPFVLGEQEKNGLAPSPDGISAGATRGKTIAASVAKRKTVNDAKRAPTASTRRKATPAKVSGK